jgi:hypothetical protein
MGMSGGPKTNTSSSVLIVDAANIKSYRGEPTVNLLPKLESWGGYIAPTRQILTVYDFPTNYGQPKRVLRIISSGALGGGGNYGGAAVSGIETLITATDNVAVSFYARSLSGNMLVNFSHQNGSGDNSNLAFSQTVGSDWTLLTKTASLNLTKTTFFIWNPNIAGGTWEIADFQLQKSSYVTPYVSGTRGSSSLDGGGWVDLTYGGKDGVLINDIKFSSESLGTLVFDSQSKHVVINDNSSLNLSNNTGGTIGVWFKTNIAAIGSFSGSLVAKGGPLSYTNGYWLTKYNSTLRISLFSGSSAPNAIELVGNKVITDNKWHYGVGTWDSGSVHLYVDGVLDVSQTYNFPFEVYTGPLYVGRHVNSAEGYFSGSIASVNIYSRPLSSTEILENFNSQRSRFGI